jgi:hypothetical protein
MGLKHLPLVNIVLFLLSILTEITLGGESLSGRLRCLGFWWRGNKRCWQILLWKSEFREFDKTNSFLMSLFLTIITKEILGRNVALISFVGRMGAAKCITLAFEEECDDLVGASCEG